MNTGKCVDTMRQRRQPRLGRGRIANLQPKKRQSGNVETTERVSLDLVDVKFRLEHGGYISSERPRILVKMVDSGTSACSFTIAVIGIRGCGARSATSRRFLAHS